MAKAAPALWVRSGATGTVQTRRGRDRNPVGVRVTGGGGDLSRPNGARTVVLLDCGMGR